MATGEEAGRMRMNDSGQAWSFALRRANVVKSRTLGGWEKEFWLSGVIITGSWDLGIGTVVPALPGLQVFRLDMEHWLWV